MNIRESQIQELERRNLERFISETYILLKTHFPLKVEKYGKQKTIEIIQNGISNAKSYHLFSESYIVKYIVVMFLLGDNFDNDPNIPWAGAIIKDKWRNWRPASQIFIASDKQQYLVTINSPETRMDRLYKMSTEYLKQPSSFDGKREAL